MPDTTESSSEVVKQKNDEIEKLKLDLEKGKTDLEKEKTRIENAQEKINSWGNEIGELRKERDELKKTIGDAKTTIESLKEISKAPVTKAEDNAVVKTIEEDPDTIEKSLTDEQRKAGESVFETLSQKEKLEYDSDPKFRISFLKRLQESAPTIPTSPWKTAVKKKIEEGSGYKSILDRVFQKKKQASYVPPGSQSGAPVLGSSNEKVIEPPEDSRVY